MPARKLPNDRSLSDRLWEKVEVGGADGCWPFVGSRTPPGYGQLWAHGRLDYAHRVSWELARGSVPAGLCVLHRCDNPPCCNPAHLFLGTHGDNSADKVRKGRSRNGRSPGEDNGLAKLTEASVAEIRRLYAQGGISQRELADRFGVTRPAIGFAIRRITWRHVP